MSLHPGCSRWGTNGVRKWLVLAVCRSTLSPLSIGQTASHTERNAVEAFEALRAKGVEVSLPNVTQVIRTGTDRRGFDSRRLERAPFGSERGRRLSGVKCPVRRAVPDRRPHPSFVPGELLAAPCLVARR